MSSRASLLYIGLGTFIALVLLFSWWQWRVYASSIATVNIDGGNLAQSRLHSVDQAAVDHFRILQASELLREQLQQPARSVNTSAFKLTRFEITQGQFASFVAWLGLQNDINSWLHPSTPKGWKFGSQSLEHRLLGRLDAPANSISFWDAYAYCRAAGGSLPSVSQWLAAASGSENRVYPWGDEFFPDPWRYQDPVLNLMIPADTYPEAATAEGLFNMGTGVSEWALGADGFAQMGGNAAARPAQLYAINYLQRQAAADYRSPYVGFRCSFAVETADSLSTSWGDELDLATIAPVQARIGVSERAYLPLLLNNLGSDAVDGIAQLLQVDSATTSAFVVSVAEISRRHYRDFLRDPLVHLGFYANANEPQNNSYKPDNWPQQLQELDLPVVNVDWWDAYAFSNWAGGKLPTENQWLALASVAERAPAYDEIIGGICLPRDCQLQPAEQLSVNSRGVAGLHDNVSEWTGTVDISSGNSLMIVKGGNALLPSSYAGNSWYSTAVPADFSSPFIGIRVVFELENSVL